MRLSTKQKKVKILEIFASSFGLSVDSACKIVDISRNTFYNWLKEDQKFKETYEALGESILDLAEASLIKQIQEMNTTATIFYLKTKGKKRGYIEQGNVLRVNTNLQEMETKSDEELEAILNRKV
jgi:transposase-like protein